MSVPFVAAGTGHRLILISTKTKREAGSGDFVCGTGLLSKRKGWWVLCDVSNYWMAEHEVSQAEFEQIMGTNPSSTKDPTLPVDQVTWSEAVAFCESLTQRDHKAGILPKDRIYRLPTLREWLTAAQPSGLNPPGGNVWHSENSSGKPYPITARRTRENGLQDLYGNVAEWTAPDPSAVKGWKHECELTARWLEAIYQQIDLQARKTENSWAHLLAVKATLRLPDDYLPIGQNMTPIEALANARDTLRSEGLGAGHPRILAIGAEIEHTRRDWAVPSDVTYQKAQSEYRINDEIRSTMREQMRKSSVEWEPDILADYFLARRGEDGSSCPSFETYLAIGGSVYDDPDTLLQRVVSGEMEDRTPGVGFRFVMADE